MLDEGNSNVENIVIDDGKDDVTIEGTIGTLAVIAPKVSVVIRNSPIIKIEINYKGATNIPVPEDGRVVVVDKFKATF